MFALPRSSWDDYDKTLISAGGGVFARSQKDIPLSDEVRAVLGLEAASIDPALPADQRIVAMVRKLVDEINDPAWRGC